METLDLLRKKRRGKMKRGIKRKKEKMITYEALKKQTVNFERLTGVKLSSLDRLRKSDTFY
jgi:hypothetical protein